VGKWRISAPLRLRCLMSTIRFPGRRGRSWGARPAQPAWMGLPMPALGVPVVNAWLAFGQALSLIAGFSVTNSFFGMEVASTLRGFPPSSRLAAVIGLWTWARVGSGGPGRHPSRAARYGGGSAGTGVSALASGGRRGRRTGAVLVVGAALSGW
jgi:hypothetical protein